MVLMQIVPELLTQWPVSQSTLAHSHHGGDDKKCDDKKCDKKCDEKKCYNKLMWWQINVMTKNVMTKKRDDKRCEDKLMWVLWHCRMWEQWEYID